MFAKIDNLKLMLEKEGLYVSLTRIEGLWHVGLGTETLFEGYSLFTGMSKILNINTTKKMLNSGGSIKSILTLSRNMDLEINKI